MDENISGLEFTVVEQKAREKNPVYNIEMFEDRSYRVRVYKIEKKMINGKYGKGEVLDWSFEVIETEFAYEYDDNGETKSGCRKISGGTSLNCTLNSKMYEWYTKIMGKELTLGESINLKNVIGKECKVFIKNSKANKANEDGSYTTFANVDRVVKSSSTTQAGEQIKKPTKKEEPKKKETVEEVAKTDEKEKESGDDLFADIF